MLISTLCFGISVVAFCSFADRIGRCLGVIDHPDGARKNHARPTPLVGGIALMIPLLAIAAMQGAVRADSWGVFAALAGAGLGFLLLGWFDDRRHTAPAARLLVSTALCAAVVALEPGLRLGTLDFGGLVLPLGLLAVPFTVLCLVGLQNAINMADGLNGLVIGLCIFWTTCLMIFAPDHLMLYLSFLLLGLFILLPYNLMGYLFLGDAGSYSLGVVVGMLMIYVYNASAELPMLTVVLWLLIPVIDCLRVMAMRLLAARSPLSGDRDHLHHRLSRRWAWPVSVLVYLTIAAVPGLVGALWPSTTVPMLLVALGAYGSVVFVTERERVRGPRGRLAVEAGRTRERVRV